MGSAASAPRGCVDFPQPGATVVAGLLQVVGWAADDHGSLAVDVEIGGTFVDRARLGLPRADVAAALGQQRTVLEGMAFELPVLATAVGDVPSVIVDEITGWLIPPSDPVALEKGLRRAIGTPPEQRRAMVEAALRYVREHRDGRHAASSFVAALQRVAAMARTA